MNNLHLSDDARADLAEIKSYIAEELGNPQAARATVKRITNTIRQLREFSMAGARLSAIANVGHGYRYLVSGDYMIFYRPIGRDIYIDRVLYGRREYLQVLFDGDLSDDMLS